VKEPVDPTQYIPAAFWEFIAHCATADTTRAALQTLARHEVAILFRTFMQARADLVHELGITGRAADASEDTLEDLAQTVLLQGREPYLSTFRGKRALPPRSDWGTNVFGVVGIFDEVYLKRFGLQIFDELED